MNQTESQQPGAAPATPKARKDWELFWRIIAGLMLLVTAWVVWVVYQIMPRSVVTPLAYSTQIRPIGAQQSGTGTEAPVAPSAPQSAAAAADPEQAAAVDTKDEPGKREGLRLATELAAPPAEKPGIATEAKPGGVPAVPAASGAAGKARP
jgi:hypothetical protein